ncbi:MAG: ECF-type sigma factor [Cellvibrionaceae bacterium]
MDTHAPVTQLLASWQSGDEKALEQLTPVIYETLRRLSARHIGKEHNPTIQATELVHEAFLDLVKVEIDWQDRAHFFAVASRLMRRLLIDRARARLRKKRGGDLQLTTLDIDQLPQSQTEHKVLELDEALNRLLAIDKRKAEALELHFFGGMTYPEIATALNISEATVDRDLRFAKAWIRKELTEPE